MYSGDVSTMSFPSSRCPMPTAEASHDRARSLALRLLNILVNTKKWTFVVICCSALAAAQNRKKLKNSLWNGGTGELVDVSNGSYHWMYRSAGEHVARELLIDLLLHFEMYSFSGRGSAVRAIDSHVDKWIQFPFVGHEGCLAVIAKIHTFQADTSEPTNDDWITLKGVFLQQCFFQYNV